MLFLHDGSRMKAHITVMGDRARQLEPRVAVTICGQTAHSQWQVVNGDKDVPLCPDCHNAAHEINDAADDWRAGI